MLAFCASICFWVVVSFASSDAAFEAAKSSAFWCSDASF